MICLLWQSTVLSLLRCLPNRIKPAGLQADGQFKQFCAGASNRLSCDGRILHSPPPPTPIIVVVWHFSNLYGCLMITCWPIPSASCSLSPSGAHTSLSSQLHFYFAFLIVQCNCPLTKHIFSLTAKLRRMVAYTLNGYHFPASTWLVPKNRFEPDQSYIMEV